MFTPLHFHHVLSNYIQHNLTRRKSILIQIIYIFPTLEGAQFVFITITVTLILSMIIANFYCMSQTQRTDQYAVWQTENFIMLQHVTHTLFTLSFKRLIRRHIGLHFVTLAPHGKVLLQN